MFLGSILMLLWLYRGPFFVPTRRKDVSRIIALLGVQPGERIVDLGSGDGRLLIAIAQAGAEAHGFEHNPFLVWRSRRNAKRLGLEDKIFVHQNNFWTVDVSRFDAVTVYGIPYIMQRLEKKLRTELKSGARVVSYSFPFPHWEPVKKEKRVYLYRQASGIAQTSELVRPARGVEI